MGIGTSGSSATSDSGALFEQWDGQSWTSLPAPPTGKIINGQPVTPPTSLSCTSTSFCAAVGGYMANRNLDGGLSAVVETWDGQAWAAPQTPVSSSSELSDVSCVGSTFCMAVGKQQPTGGQIEALSESWDGSQWASIPMPAQSGSSLLQSVSCMSANFCLAAGTSEPSDAGQSGDQTEVIAEVWNGSSWTTAASPRSFGHDLSLSQPVLDCMAQSQCLVVWSSTWPVASQGGPTPPDAGFSAVSQLWNGTEWSSVPIFNPDPASSGFNVFYDESCASATDCTVVGSTIKGANRSSAIESWDGSQWTVEPISTTTTTTTTSSTVPTSSTTTTSSTVPTSSTNAP